MKRGQGTCSTFQSFQLRYHARTTFIDEQTRTDLGMCTYHGYIWTYRHSAYGTTELCDTYTYVKVTPILQRIFNNEIKSVFLTSNKCYYYTKWLA